MIHVMLVDDHQILREGLASLLEKEPDLKIVGQAQNGRDAVKRAAQLRPNVVVMDIAMPDLNGAEATAQILRDNPDIKVVALSMHQDRQYVGRMLQAGVSGYLLKDCAAEELAQAVRTVNNGETYLGTKIDAVVIADYVERLKHHERESRKELTAREREVCQLMAEGKATKEIALRLHLSAKTIETHRRKIMDKLNIRSVAELTKYAVREGLTSLDT